MLNKWALWQANIWPQGYNCCYFDILLVGKISCSTELSMKKVYDLVARILFFSNHLHSYDIVSKILNNIPKNITIIFSIFGTLQSGKSTILN